MGTTLESRDFNNIYCYYHDIIQCSVNIESSEPVIQEDQSLIQGDCLEIPAFTFDDCDNDQFTYSLEDDQSQAHADLDLVIQNEDKSLKVCPKDP